MANLEIWAAKKEQVPVDLRLLCCHTPEGEDSLYIVMSTTGPPFGGTSSIRPFMMADGDLYAVGLRGILQEEMDNNCSGAGTKEALCNFADDSNCMAALLEEFAVKFRQKAIKLEERARVGNVGSPTDQI